MLKEYNYPLNAKKIASLTKENYNTVRAYLNRLHKKGILLKPTRGFYCINPTYGVGGGFVVPRVHNVRFVVKGLGRGLESGVVEDVVGRVKLRVVFGSKRNLVSGVICCDDGLDFNGFRLAVELVKRIIEDRLRVKISDDDVLITSFELNEDYAGLRLDGVECLTLKSFVGWLERIYNKGYGLRNEIKVSGGFRLEEVYTLLKGGVPIFNVVQSNFLLSRKIEELTDAIKFQSRVLYDNVNQNKAIFDRVIKILDSNFLPQKRRERISTFNVLQKFGEH